MILEKCLYIQKVLDEAKQKNSSEPEFLQAVSEVLNTIEPVIKNDGNLEKQALLEEYQSVLLDTESTAEEILNQPESYRRARRIRKN